MVKKVVFGGTLLPQEFTIGLPEPQTEVSVWLHGIGPPRDVTGRHTTACTAPLILCIAFHEADERPGANSRAVVRFCESGGRKRVLGEIRLKVRSALALDSSEFILFEVRGSTNRCLPRSRLWAHYLLQAWSQRRRNDPADIRMTLLEQRAAWVTFIRPHPLSLVSLGDETAGNIFPMNLMGDLGNGYFGFALRERRLAAHLVERAGRIAVSSVPLARCWAPFQLAINHKKESIDWKQLPFETKPSTTFGIPAPSFAARVREMRIEKVQPVGSHRFFIARVVSDEIYGAGLQACVVHGFYQFRRVKGDAVMLHASVAEDAANKLGYQPG